MYKRRFALPVACLALSVKTRPPTSGA
jgi:hypothetical protein